VQHFNKEELCETVCCCILVKVADACLSGLMQEVANILANGIKLREYTKGVENNIRQIELDSIQVIVIADVICA
jgi:hypothetical protein